MTDTAPHPTAAGRAHPTAILAIILVSYFMILLDNSIIFTGLPTIGEAMDLSPVGPSWVQDAYTLVFGGLLLLGARLGDILGRRRALVFAIVESAEIGWAAPGTIAALVVGVVFLAVLGLNEARAAQPIMPLHLFASRVRSGAYLARMLYLGAMIGFCFFTTQFLQGVLGYSAVQAGVAFFPMTVVNFVVAVAIPRLTRRVGNASLLAAGVLITFLGMAWLSRVDAGSVYLTAVALPMALIGAGQGLAFAPLTAAGISGVDLADAGAASGLVNTAHQLGSALGLGILVAVSATVSASTDTVAGLADHISTALTAGAGLLALALVVTLALVLPSGVAEHRLARAAGEGRPEPAQRADQSTAPLALTRTR